MTTTQIPRMERGAADSISIAMVLVYVLDISGESTSRARARVRRRRKHIIEVTMMFRLTLSENQGTARRAGLPFIKDMFGIALSSTVRIASTEKQPMAQR